jgi:hypothetical protein
MWVMANLSKVPYDVSSVKSINRDTWWNFVTDATLKIRKTVRSARSRKPACERSLNEVRKPLWKNAWLQLICFVISTFTNPFVVFFLIIKVQKRRMFQQQNQQS